MPDRIEKIDIVHAQFIAKRRPCIITCLHEELSSLLSYRDTDTLRQHAGDAIVSVEPISDRGTFGTGATKQEMPFSAFLQKLEATEDVYLTTQYSEEETAILHEPLKTLKEHMDFPLCPDFIPLVPAKINLWLGASKSGTTSGLHHDFHDNIYILLSGVKKFRIFPPTWKNVKALAVRGKPHEIYENGLISYHGTLCADGLVSSTKAQIRVDVRGEVLTKLKESEKDTEAAEESYEDAMEQLLDSKLADSEGSEDGSFGAEDEFDEEEGGYADEDEVDDAHENAANATSDYVNSTPSKAAQTRELSPITDISEATSANEPPSFSALSSSEVTNMLADSTLGGEEFILEAGQMLYLPASYFHEVISLSGDHNYHMALNYWFYPPDTADGKYSDPEVMDELRRRLDKRDQDGEPARKRTKMQ